MKRALHLLGELFLWLAAVLGGISILLVVLGWAMNISLIMFRTGSMEPTIPTGAVAVVQEISAEEVEVGDILTVDRDDQLPVTHRVTSIEPGAGSAERVIRMQGDANETEDPHPYTITEARLSLFHIPHIANAVNQLNNPYLLGLITVVAAAGVGWTFWPREEDRPCSSAAPSPAPASPPPRHRPRHTSVE
ncbi:signal peptidase I [Nesterenkonia sp. AY15]|uniref:signal peptidase I n=1 Tax=Nesterenkonia sp. AY15 TaxID=2901139 RepID=UPI001F4CA786|nr:signal peptidase I [Nesterenkonia sp. AY15]MCH8569789.1 signal peptidase I [Nesterenkonia sp. AY15]